MSVTLPSGNDLETKANAFEKIGNSLANLSKAIFRTPYGFLVIVLCIIIYYQYQQNLSKDRDYKELNNEYIQTLKQVKSGLEEISDTTKKENNVPIK